MLTSLNNMNLKLQNNKNQQKEETESLSSIKSKSSKLPAPPPPSHFLTEESNTPSLQQQPKITDQKPDEDMKQQTVTIINNSQFVNSLDSIIEELFENICDDVIKCDDRAPSVPDVILQVISELLADASSSNKEEEEVENAEEVVSLRENGNNSQLGVVSIMSNSHNMSPEHKINSPQNKINNINNKPAVTRIISNYTSSHADMNSLPKSTSSSSSISSSNSPRAFNSNSSKNNPVYESNMMIETMPNPSSTNTVDTSAASSTTYGLTALQQQKLNRNRIRKTISKTFIIDGQTHTVQKIVNQDEEERQRKLIEDRKRDLIEHRRNLNEDRRKLIDLTRKQDTEKEVLEHDFKEQRDKLLKEFELKLGQVYQMRKTEIEKCEEAQTSELKSTMKKIKNEQEKALRLNREQLKDEFKMFKKELDSNAVQQHVLMSKEHREILKKQKEKELLKRVNLKFLRNFFIQFSAYASIFRKLGSTGKGCVQRALLKT
jgi:hypothetical protein